MGDVVVFYSNSGNTRFVAQRLAAARDARLVELREEGSRRGILGFVKSGFQAKTGRSSKLTGDPWSEAEGPGRLFLLSPIWAGSGSPALNAFLDKANLTGREVVLVTLQADPGKGGSDEVHRHFAGRIEAAGGKVVSRHALRGAVPGRFAGEEALERELATLL